MAKGTSPRDSRFKSFRTAAYGIYIVVVAVFSSLLIFSVFKSVAQMSPRAADSAEKQLTGRECVDGVERLWRSLDGRRRAFTDAKQPTEIDADFARFRTGWMKELRALESRCAVESRSRVALKQLFGRMQKLQSLYTTHSVQFAGELAPEVERFTEGLRAARKEAQGR